MNSKKAILLIAILTSAAGFSQSSPKKIDSVKVSVQDMCAATIKMIERKQLKEQLQASEEALTACDSSKAFFKKANNLLKADLDLLKRQNTNSEQIAEFWKKEAKNEKNRGITRGLWGFLIGTVAGALTVVFTN